MKRTLADTLQIEPQRLNLKATTEERLGFTGRGEGISCHAVCLLEEG
jgi:2-C-methyl-D-erythritol 2,4-cyclodiphosphate synthase